MPPGLGGVGGGLSGRTGRTKTMASSLRRVVKVLLAQWVKDIPGKGWENQGFAHASLPTAWAAAVECPRLPQVDEHATAMELEHAVPPRI